MILRRIFLWYLMDLLDKKQVEEGGSEPSFTLNIDRQIDGVWHNSSALRLSVNHNYTAKFYSSNGAFKNEITFYINSNTIGVDFNYPYYGDGTQTYLNTTNVFQYTGGKGAIGVDDLSGNYKTSVSCTAFANYKGYVEFYE